MHACDYSIREEVEKEDLKFQVTRLLREMLPRSRIEEGIRRRKGANRNKKTVTMFPVSLQDVVCSHVLLGQTFL